MTNNRVKKRRLLFYGMIGLLIVSMVFLKGERAFAFSGGTGTQADPYLISNVTQFLTIQNSPTSHYKLTADIDLAATTFNGFGTTDTWFRGSLDGNGFAIKNMTINKPTTDYVGLFSGIYSNNSSYTGVKNLTFENAVVTGKNYLGIIAGQTSSSSSTYVTTIENITMKNSQVLSSSGYLYIGGLVGFSNQYGSISNVDADVNVRVDTTVNDFVTNSVGGIVGYAYYTPLSNIVMKGSILVKSSYNISYIGGIAGRSTYSDMTGVTNYANLSIEQISTTSSIGGISGYHSRSKSSKISNYGDVNITGSSSIKEVGGIFGLEYRSYDPAHSQSDITNAGNITLSSTGSYAEDIGGISGEVSGGGIYQRIQNTGNITSNTAAYAYYFGGLYGHFVSRYTIDMDELTSTSDITINTTNSTIYYIGGAFGRWYMDDAYGVIDDIYTSGTIKTDAGTENARRVGGILGYQYASRDSTSCTTDAAGVETCTTTTSGSSSRSTINRGYSDVSIWVEDAYASPVYYPGGLMGESYGTVNNLFALNPKIENATTPANYYTDFSDATGAKSGIRKLDTLIGNTRSATDITAAASKQWTTYSGVSFLDTVWGIKEGISYPYLKNVIPAPKKTLKPAPSEVFQTLSIPFEWQDKGIRNTASYEVKVEKKGPLDSVWSPATTLTTSSLTETFTVPAGTPGNTKFRYQVRGRNAAGVYGNYTLPVEFLFANNVPTISGTFVSAEKDLTTSLSKRVMNFTVSSIVDPDTFNYVKLTAEIPEIAGSKKQLGTNLSGAVVWNSKNYKLKIIPTFSSAGSTYDLSIVDAVNENTIISTLVNDRPMQNQSAASPENLTLKIYAEDFQNSNNSLLSQSTMLSQAITVDTRNFLPRAFNVTNDVSGRTMSTNQGYNRINFQGSIEDLDPTDDIDVYYAVKLATDKVAGNYLVNPNGDTFVKNIPSSGSGTLGTFSATYTIQDGIANGNYVLLVYGVDARDGIGDPVVIPFTINKTGPEIRFFADFNGNSLSSAQRQVVAKDYKLKMYFSAYNHVTLEYAGYVIRAGQQNSTGVYEDLKIRGAFTNDVTSQFIGVDLSNPYYKKGDMLVFKFRATSSDGTKINKDIRILIGDSTRIPESFADTKIPASLLAN